MSPHTQLNRAILLRERRWPSWCVPWCVPWCGAQMGAEINLQEGAAAEGRVEHELNAEDARTQFERSDRFVHNQRAPLALGGREHCWPLPHRLRRVGWRVCGVQVVGYGVVSS